jgi:hypothetical protein
LIVGDIWHHSVSRNVVGVSQASKRRQSRTRRVVAPSTSDWTSRLQQLMDDTLIWCQRVLHVFGEGQISSRSRSCGLWWLGSGVERSIGVVEDADPPRTGECQQHRVVKLLELVRSSRFRQPDVRLLFCCALPLLSFVKHGMEVHGHSTRWPRFLSAAAAPPYRSS